MVATMSERVSAVLVLTGTVCVAASVAMDRLTWAGTAITGSVGGAA
jgi:hypothetical protein